MVTTDASIPVTYGTATAIGGKPPVTVTCRPESGSPFKVGQTTVICTATDAVGQADSCSFAVTVLPPPRLVATTFVGFGDSITAGESGLGVLSGTAALEPFSRFRPTVLLPASQWYTTVLQQSLAARYRTQTPTVANAGKTGEAVLDPDTFPRFASVLSAGYQVVLLMEGTNDLYARDARLVQPTVEGLRRMVLYARGQGRQVFIATIPPIDPSGFRGATYGWSLVPDLNAGIRSMAASTNVPLVDVYAGFTNNLLGPDGLHPNADGYARIAELFFAAIKQNLEVSQSLPASLAGAPLVRRR